MSSEITEEGDIGSSYQAEKEKQKKNILKIIQHQKSLYLSSSSSSSSSAVVSNNGSSFSYSRRSNSLMDLMKGGSTSLRRLFDMEHTTLAAYIQDYSGSPLIKPIPLWGSDEDDDDELHGDPWSSMKKHMESAAADHHSVPSKVGFVDEEEEEVVMRKKRIRKRKLRRKKSFRNLPIRFGLWKFRGFRFFRFMRFRRLRIILCGRIF